MNHTDERIKKLAAAGLSDEQIARKIGRPDDVERVRKVTVTVACAECVRTGPVGHMIPAAQPFTYLCTVCALGRLEEEL